jgi:hypothetical protein
MARHSSHAGDLAPRGPDTQNSTLDTSPPGGRVIRPGVKGPRLVALFLFGLLLLNFPLLALFDRPAEVFGIPSLFAYVFAVWALLIGLMALVLERSGD